MKRTILAVMVSIIILIFSSCTKAENVGGLKRYQATFLTLFDTVTSIVGYAEDEDAFTAKVNSIHAELLSYHQLYDIYREYPGINNLKTVNDNAGIAPVKVDPKIIDLLLFCKDAYLETEGLVNVAMGSVLSLWHEARTAGIDNPMEAVLPDMDKLMDASEHMDFSSVLIDEEASTVFIQDPLMSLDVGAIAKGFAVEAISNSFDGPYLISVGGNVSSLGKKPDGSSWIVGLQDTDGDNGKNKHTLYLDCGSVVTSGSYQRYYVVDGEVYHHIIDPNTLMPSNKWKAVSVIANDSGVADALSTALFLLSKEDGELLLSKFGGVAVWTDNDGNEYFSPGFSDFMRT